jgi:hypothetical protein
MTTYPVVTNNDLGSVQLKNCEFADEILTLSGAQTVAEGRILARDSVTGKLVHFYPGGAAVKSTSDGLFNLSPGDTMVLDVDNAGNATITWDAAAATILDTTVYPVADQDGLTSIITLSGGPWDGIAQTVTFSGAHTTAAQIAASMNAQLDGCSVDVSGGQVRITTDGAGTSMNIAAAAGTGGLTWAASTAGTGDVGDISAVTAAEVKTRIEADSTATATVVGAAVEIKSSTELDFISGLALTKLGLSVETVTANENGIPKFVLGYELAGANGDNPVRPIKSGVVREEKLNILDGSTVSSAILDQLRNYSIVAESVEELNIQDNQ